jgi:hypothetical protein
MNAHRLLFALCLSSAVSAADFAAWTHHQTVRVTQTGLTRLDLAPALLDASRTTSGAPFHDLRIINPEGVETPYIIALPRTLRPNRVDATAFKATLNATTTVLEFQPPTGDTITELMLQTNAQDFIKAATLEASHDRITWQTLGSGEIICRQSNTERMRLPITPTAWKHFRVTLDDTRSAPVVFTGAQVLRELPELRTVSQTVSIRTRNELKNETHLTLDLGTANVMLGSVRLHTPEPVFQREAALLGTRTTLFRLKHDGFTGEELDIPVHQLATTREVELVIRHGDSPPLLIERIEATRHAVPIVFQANTPGEWQMYIGNAQSAEPRYDITAVSDKLRDASANSVVAGDVQLNSAFRKTATAPEVGDSAAVLDVSAWSYRRPIAFQEAGVIELELDPAVLARSESDLHDLRVIRDGRQIPYLILKPGTQREVDVAFSEVPDAKAPTYSHWDITLPFAAFPASELIVESSSPLFERQLTVMEYRDTNQGRVGHSSGSAMWRRKPGQPNEPLRIKLHNPLQTDTLKLSTDNGDNAPLKLTSIRVSHPVVRLLFRVSDTTPVYLCYGHCNASYPRYDLDLVRREFETATKVSATLGEEETLSGYKSMPTQSPVSGSPWLWAALTLVVGGLLWIVARLLPKQAV